MPEVRLGMLFGGRSEEHPVSLTSARQVAASLDLDRYEPYWIGITTEGHWLLCEGPEGDWQATGRPVALSPDPSVAGLLLRAGDGIRELPLDAVLPILHGRFGEDGTVQGLLELSGVPYAGCDVPSSAMCMDKAVTYAIVAGAGIAVPEHRIVLPHGDIDPDTVDYPVFVKPARSGSSFGVSRVSAADGLAAAVEDARRYDPKVLIEAAVSGHEIGCALLGDDPDLVIGEPDRVALSHGFFRIHQERAPESGSENASLIVPADISEEDRDRVRETALRIYRALGCRGLARVDLFLVEDGTVLLNEVNTLPGLTSYSRFPRMMAAAGWSLSRVIDRLVSDALARPRR